MTIYEQLLKSLGINYKRIGLILVRTKNYASEIKYKLKDFSELNENLDYLDKIYFQVIYLNDSYFVESLRTNADEIKNIQGELENVRNDLIKKDEKIEKLSNENKNLQKANDDLKKITR